MKTQRKYLGGFEWISIYYKISQKAPPLAGGEDVTEDDVKRYIGGKKLEKDVKSVAIAKDEREMLEIGKTKQLTADRMIASFRNIPQFSTRFLVEMDYVLKIV